MVYEIKNEMEVGKGFGLPRLTTVQRMAYTPPSDGFQVFDTDLKGAFTWYDTKWNTASADATRTFEAINQVAHGFSITNAVYHDGTDWKGAQALDSGVAVAQGIVTAVTDVDNFEVTTHGVATVTGHGLTVGEYYWLDQATAGAITDIQPTTGAAQSLLNVRDANTIMVDTGQALAAADATTSVLLHRTRLSLSANQSLAAGATDQILFDATEYDVGSIATTSSVTITQDGYYELSAMWMNVSGDANLTASTILVDGNPVASGGENQPASGGNSRRMPAHAIKYLTTGQVVTVTATSGQATFVSGNATENGTRAYLEVNQLPTLSVMPATAVEIDLTSVADGDTFEWDATNSKLIPQTITEELDAATAAATLNQTDGTWWVISTSTNPANGFYNLNQCTYHQIGKLRYYQMWFMSDADDPISWEVIGAVDVYGVAFNTASGPMAVDVTGTGINLGSGKTGTNTITLNRADSVNVDHSVGITFVAKMA